MTMRTILLLLALCLGSAACAQIPPGHATTSPVGPDPVERVVDDRTETERAVEAALREPGIHVVHFWAPWCGNSQNEFASGWYETIEAHPEVSFTFVTIWNDGEDGAAMLERYGIPERVTVLAQPDRGPSADRSLRRTSFLGLPLSWTPTTWIFNREGRLAYAFNYGEVSAEMLETALAHAADSWHHD